MLTAIFFSLLPDIAKVFYLTELKHNKYLKEYLVFHSAIQTETGWILGILTQVIVAIILFIFLFL